MRILALGLLLAVLILLGTILLYVRRWSAGRPAEVDWLAGLRRLPRAYLHDVHEVVSRESLAGGMHALTAGGLLASLALLVLMAWAGWRGVFPGCFCWRASPVSSPDRCWSPAGAIRRSRSGFSGGRFQILPFLLLIFPLVAAPIAFAEMGLLPEGPGGVPPGQILTSLLLLALAAQIAGGPLKHVVAGALHLIVHPRPARFGATLPVADLAPLDLTARAARRRSDRRFCLEPPGRLRCLHPMRPLRIRLPGQCGGAAAQSQGPDPGSGRSTAAAAGGALPGLAPSAADRREPWGPDPLGQRRTRGDRARDNLGLHQLPRLRL